MVREHRDLPTGQDYLYNPRRDNGAQNPPLSPDLFQHLFYTCHWPYTWLTGHGCAASDKKIVHVQRIPKRNREFKDDLTSPIWDLETNFEVSFAYVLVYHCIMVAGPFGFFAWWLKDHPGDLTTASVPVTIVLGALSLFWSGAGILTTKPLDR